MFRGPRFAIILFLIIFSGRALAQTSAGSGAANSAKPPATSSPNQNSIEGKVERYLRNAFAWGPAFQVKVGPIKPSPIPELLEVTISVTTEGHSENAVVYVDKNGGFLMRGELSDMSVDPLADDRSKLHLGNSPSTGPENAHVTLVEFADFECPSCRQLDLILRDLLTRHPEIRLVYKHFPLTNAHPWAMTAAIASQCAYQQDPAAFWKMHDAIFDAQDLISPSTVWDKLIDLGNQLALNMDNYRSCMADPSTAHTVEQSIQEGQALTITATPTTFVNGRRVVGPDQPLIEQYIQFEESRK